ncbi:MAG: permease-like cell division protein FtsX, partial [Bacteroidetes bacterium]|nr:permease-like cell division protein FtsX [Bacteroidota bacterium]
MSSTQQKRVKKSNPSYISSIISVSLILFVLGIIASFFLQSAKLSQSVKENIALQLVLEDKLNESDIFQFSEQLKTNPYVKESEIFTKEDAALMMKEDLGEDFVQTIGYNPLPNAIILHLNAAYSVPDSLLWIKEDLLASGNVQAVNYDELLLSNISAFTSKFLLALLVFLAILLVISFIIIDSTIKLAMFS